MIEMAYMIWDMQNDKPVDFGWDEENKFENKADAEATVAETFIDNSKDRSTLQSALMGVRDSSLAKFAEKIEYLEIRTI